MDLDALREAVSCRTGRRNKPCPEHEAVLVAAARAVLDSEEAWWCWTHESSADEPPSDFPHFCLAEQVNGHDAEPESYCVMEPVAVVRVRLLAEEGT